MKPAYSIWVSSQKGGVGKTTISVNLAILLGEQNFKVLLIDNDLISPSVGLLLDIGATTSGIREVMSGKLSLERAIIKHDSGIDVLPGTQRYRGIPKIDAIAKVLRKAKKLGNYDFIITDTAPGYWYPELARLYDEALIVSTITTPSLASAMRFGMFYNKEQVKHNFILNKMTNDRYSITTREAEDALSQRTLTSLPEDSNVPKAESFHIPVYLYKNRSPFCQQLRVLARFYAAQRGGEEMLPEVPKGHSFWSTFVEPLRWLFRTKPRQNI